MTVCSLTEPRYHLKHSCLSGEGPDKQTVNTKTVNLIVLVMTHLCICSSLSRKREGGFLAVVPAQAQVRGEDKFPWVVH